MNEARRKIDPDGQYGAEGLRTVEQNALRLIDLWPRDWVVERARDVIQLSFGGEVPSGGSSLVRRSLGTTGYRVSDNLRDDDLPGVFVSAEESPPAATKVDAGKTRLSLRTTGL